MQQAYREIRVVSEAQTVRIVLSTLPGEPVLQELTRASAGLLGGSDDGIKAVVLDFNKRTSVNNETTTPLEALAQARAAIHAIPQPVLAVVRGDLSVIASQLLGEADFILIAHEATLPEGVQEAKKDQDKAEIRIAGLAAHRLGYATWTASLAELPREMERILDLLRGKSAIALRNAKASIRLAAQQGGNSLAALRQINDFYLATVMQTQDASEGLRAFLEKRQPRWSNR